MKTDRLDFLLEKASEAFADARNPFETSFLTEHNVTLDECMDLSLAVSAAIDLLRIPLMRAKHTADIKKLLNKKK